MADHIDAGRSKRSFYTPMYQDSLSLLNAGENSNAISPSSTAKKPVYRRNFRTHDVRAARIAERRAYLAALGLDEIETNALIHDDDAGYRASTRAEADLHAYFDEPLPIVTGHVIPFGTHNASESGDHPMDGSYIDTVPGAADLEPSSYSPQVSYFIRNSRAVKTRELYRWAWARALKACRAFNLCVMPMSVSTATTVMVDAVNDGLVFGSLKIIACVIAAAHEIAGEVDPTRSAAFRAMMRGIGRAIGSQPERKEAITIEDLRLIYEATKLRRTLALAVRDWAMIAIGFAAAARRSELTSRNVDDCVFHEDHVRIWLDRSKTDQFGEGIYLIIQPAKDPELCPVAALRRWIDMLPGPGPLFRNVNKHGTIGCRRLNAQVVSETVKAYGIVLDLPEDRLGAHSLRAGMITALIDSDLATEKTMKHSRHRQQETLMKYYRPRGLGPNMTQAAGL